MKQEQKVSELNGRKIIKKNSESALRICRRVDRSKYFAMELSAITLLEVIYIMHNLRVSGFDDV